MVEECKQNIKRKSIIQFIKFGCVGFSNTIISLIVYYFFVWINWSYVIANTMGFLVSILNAYFWNSKYVFRNGTENSKGKAFFKMFVSYLGSFCLSTVLITFMVEILGISQYLAPILRLVVTVPINFFVNKIWAFRDKG